MPKKPVHNLIKIYDSFANTKIKSNLKGANKNVDIREI